MKVCKLVYLDVTTGKLARVPESVKTRYLSLRKCSSSDLETPENAFFAEKRTTPGGAGPVVLDMTCWRQPNASSRPARDRVLASPPHLW